MGGKRCSAVTVSENCRGPAANVMTSPDIRRPCGFFCVGAASLGVRITISRGDNREYGSGGCRSAVRPTSNSICRQGGDVARRHADHDGYRDIAGRGADHARLRGRSAAGDARGHAALSAEHPARGHSAGKAGRRQPAVRRRPAAPSPRRTLTGPSPSWPGARRQNRRTRSRPDKAPTRCP
jgi:hypothetical protein